MKYYNSYEQNISILMRRSIKRNQKRITKIVRSTSKKFTSVPKITEAILREMNSEQMNIGSFCLTCSVVGPLQSWA